MDDKNCSEVKCPNCGGNKFKQEVIEVYYRYIDSEGEVIEYEEDCNHDLDFGSIHCVNCDEDCTELFDEID